MKTDNAIIKVE